MSTAADGHELHVAAGVLVDASGRVLIARRGVSKHMGGSWEFPGGKVEAGETPRQALSREIEEELAIQITQARPWITLPHTYPHASVLLHFFIVTDWTGTEHGREGQQLCWQKLSELTISPLLAANAPVIRALQLPEIYAISCVSEIGEEEFLHRLAVKIDHGLQLLQLREKSLSNCQLHRRQ